MHSSQQHNGSLVAAFRRGIRHFSHRVLQRRVICCVVGLNLLLWTGPGLAADSFIALGSQVLNTRVGFHSYEAFFLRRLLPRLFSQTTTRARRETTADRTARVTTIRINPSRIVGYTGQRLQFSAVGSNSGGMTIQGAQFTWTSSDPEKLQVDNSGLASLSAPGLVWLTAATPHTSARTPVLIRSGERPVQSDSEWKNDQNQLRPDGTVGTTSSGGVGSMLASLFSPTAHAQANGGDSADFLYDELWSEPRNLVGSPSHRVMTSSAIGAVLPEGSNFEFSAPLYSLSGRGVSAGIALNYNSRVWSRHGSAVTFNAVNTWPYLGFTLSFGRIVTYGSSSSSKFVLIEGDGTRRYLGTGALSSTGTYQTTDGSHITYVGNGTTGGTLYYNNGMSKGVGIHNNRLLVHTVTDNNGNQFSIYYKSLPETSCVGFQGYQAIDYIYDTLGRVIQFNYDDCNNLTSIDVPGYGGTAESPVTTTIARFDYTTPVISTSFSGLTVENAPTGWTNGKATLLSHVYFPATNTGHKFTYSAYGMITTVSLRKDMSYNSGTGAITDGNEKAYVSFNYPASASSLTDAPSFSQWTQFPAATSGGTATYSLSSSTDSGAQTKTFVVTRPDSSQFWATRDTNASHLANGLVSQAGVYNNAASIVTYANDPGGSVQAESIKTINNIGQETYTTLEYDQYGNLTNVREYGFQHNSSWVVRRRTRNVYKTTTSYVNAYLRNLVIETDVYDAQLDTNDGNDVLLAKTTYTHDDYNAMGGMENYGGTTYAIGHSPGYDASYTLRGNVTGVTQYSDVNAPTSITHLRKIDIFGNTVKEELSCCNQQVTTTDDANGYAMPTEVVKGDPGGTTLTTRYNSDFNTSLQDDVTDPNNLQVAVSSRDAALRPTQIDSPTGAMTTASYNDSAMSVTGNKVYDDNGTQKTVTKTTEYDGWGRVIHQINAHGGQVNTNYDNMGRVASTTNPFTAGGSPSYSTSYSYDALGRTTTVTLPDSQTTTTVYSGNSLTITDQVNRKIQRLTDGLGRLVTVNEQDSSGYLTQATNYTYNYLDALTQVDQGGQLRNYKYDALSRLLFEKIPEQTDSISDGTNTWTIAYTYTDYNAISTKTDARGVVTTNSYDSLHRLTQVSYNSVSGVTKAPTVYYYYDYESNYSISNEGGLVRVLLSDPTNGAQYEEFYTLDSDKQPASTIRKVYTTGGTTRTYTTSYILNEASQATQLTYPSGLGVAVNHDSAGRMSGLQNASTQTNYLSGLTYDMAGQVVADTLGNGITEQFGYDAARMQLTTQKAGTSSPYTNRMDLTYSYSASSGQMGVGSTAGNAGQLMSISGTINATTESASYTYDNYGRLATSNQTSNGSSAQRRFAYDRWGNRTGVWNATSGGTQIQSISLAGSGGNPTNQVASVTAGSTVNYTYDAAGNVTNDGVHTYEYDSENRIVSVDGGLTASYAYDDQNRRYKKTVGSTVTHYVWQDDQVIAEHNGSTGAVQVDYLYSGSRMIAKLSGGTTQYLLRDRLSTRMVLNNSGTVLGRQSHLPFGEDFAESGTQEKHHFTLYERDAESGTDYAINRHSAQALGRFNQADSLAISAEDVLPQTWNRYSYGTNDPVNTRDPLGLDDEGLDENQQSIEDCQSSLDARLRALYPNNVGVPYEFQINAAFNALVATEGNAALLFATWWYETNFASPAPNLLSASVYGPMQLRPETAAEVLANHSFPGITLAGVLGNLNSPIFNGNIAQNLAVGSWYLEDLLRRITKKFPRFKKNDKPIPEPDGLTLRALAGAAYEGPSHVIGKRPRDLGEKYRRRFDVYYNVLPVFKRFATCLRNLV
jgi:RHS repeat-associated protein